MGLIRESFILGLGTLSLVGCAATPLAPSSSSRTPAGVVACKILDQNESTSREGATTKRVYTYTVYFENEKDVESCLLSLDETGSRACSEIKSVRSKSKKVEIVFKNQFKELSDTQYIVSGDCKAKQIKLTDYIKTDTAERNIATSGN